MPKCVMTSPKALGMDTKMAIKSEKEMEEKIIAANDAFYSGTLNRGLHLAVTVVEKKVQ